MESCSASPRPLVTSVVACQPISPPPPPTTTTTTTTPRQPTTTDPNPPPRTHHRRTHHHRRTTPPPKTTTTEEPTTTTTEEPNDDRRTPPPPKNPPPPQPKNPPPQPQPKNPPPPPQPKNPPPPNRRTHNHKPPCRPVRRPRPRATTTSTTSAARAAPTTTPRPIGDRPNILVVMTDDQGCDQHVDLPVRSVQAAMPFTASLPGGDWYVAHQARTHNSVCCPNRGRPTDRDRPTFTTACSAMRNAPAFSDTEYLPVALARRLRTGHFGKFLNCFPSATWTIPGRWFMDVPKGWDRWVADKERRSTTTSPSSRTAVQHWSAGAGRRTTSRTGSVTASWTGSVSSPEPWFAYFTPFGPQPPGTSARILAEHRRALRPTSRTTTRDAQGRSTRRSPTQPVSRSRAGHARRARPVQRKGAQWGVDRRSSPSTRSSTPAAANSTTP